MITAIVLVSAAPDRIPEVAAAIAEVAGVSECYSTTGDVDLVALVRVREHDELATVIPAGIDKVPGVLGTRTMVAFQAYSKHDLEAAFSLGGD